MRMNTKKSQDSDASSRSLPCHYLAGSCQSQFGHCMLRDHSARPRKIRPRQPQQRRSRYYIPRSHEKCPRGHGDCGPHLGVVSHVWDCPVLPRDGNERTATSALIRLHSICPELDCSLHRGLYCQPIMYCGSVGHAVFGSLVIIMSLLPFVIPDLRDH
ncbi:hypothetical protein N7467_006000 [Penicillium canescens]|nr:hypothetical protein N7467_006000 [Penicillium canescens]